MKIVVAAVGSLLYVVRATNKKAIICMCFMVGKGIYFDKNNVDFILLGKYSRKDNEMFKASHFK